MRPLRAIKPMPPTMVPSCTFRSINFVIFDKRSEEKPCFSGLEKPISLDAAKIEMLNSKVAKKIVMRIFFIYFFRWDLVDTLVTESIPKFGYKRIDNGLLITSGK